MCTESRVHGLRMLSTMAWFSDGLSICLQSLHRSTLGTFFFLVSNISQAADEKEGVLDTAVKETLDCSSAQIQNRGVPGHWGGWSLVLGSTDLNCVVSIAFISKLLWWRLVWISPTRIWIICWGTSTSLPAACQEISLHRLMEIYLHTVSHVASCPRQVTGETNALPLFQSNNSNITFSVLQRAP